MWYYITAILIACLISLGIIKLAIKCKIIKFKKYYIYILLLDTILLLMIFLVFKESMYIENMIFAIFLMAVLNYSISRTYISLNTRKQGIMNLNKAKFKED